jgi:hypothetical protein
MTVRKMSGHTGAKRAERREVEMTCRKIAAGTLVGVLASAGLVGCGSGSGPKGGAVDESSSPSASPSVSPSAAPCRAVPVSTGPATDLVVLQVDAPASATSGAEVPVRVSLHVRRDGPRIVTTTARSEILVVHDGQVVAGSGTSDGRLAVPLPLRAGAVRPGQVLPGTVRLAGCATGAGGSAEPLPPGRYGIVAVLAYGEDALNTSAGGAGGRFQLVSRPVPLQVT